MEILKPIFAAIYLLGIHISRPFHTFLLDKDTNYTVLMAGLKCLYNDLTTIDSAFLMTTKKVVTFVDEKMFIESLPDRLLETLD